MRQKLVTLVILVVVVALATHTAPALAACCSIASVNPSTGLVKAREAATGRTFEFTVIDARQRFSLRVGQVVEADFGAQTAWVPPSPARYKIVNIIETGRQPVPRQSLAPPMGAAPSMPSKGTAPPSPSTGSPTSPSCPTVTSAAFLKIDGIVGESLDACHKGQIELLQFQAGGGGQTIAVAKRIDIVSPSLFLNTLMGRHIKRADLTIYTTGAQPQRLGYTMTDVIVTSVAQSVGPGTRENVTLMYAKLETRSSPVAVFIAPPPAEAPVEIFLRLDGVQGDAQDAAHKDEIVVRSFTSGASIPMAGGGRASVQDFVINKNIDKASPALMLAYNQGKHIKQGIITLRRGGQDFYRYKIYDIIIRAFSQTLQGESVSLRFAKVEIEHGGGATAGGVAPKMGWDIKSNKKL